MTEQAKQTIHDRITPDAARFIQESIAEAKGQEVFFAGSMDQKGRVCKPRVLARGNSTAVPALFEQLDIRDVVIHNHPSGDLTPSEPDLGLASLYGNQGHGMFIVDNEVLSVYVVVEPFLPKDATPLDTAALGRAFSPDSPLARTLPHFEVRPQQARMMELVARAFNRNGIGIVEAPTGIGKTIAYLLPAVQWALLNKERVVISTRTINLQEQIVFKDVPLIQQVLGVDFQACLVKGRYNYVCRRKLSRFFAEATLFDDDESKDQLDHLAKWVEKTRDGSRSDLPFVPSRALWEQVASESDTCAMGRCPDQKRCFVTQARRDMAKADLLVANHHMLFSDISIKKETGDFSAMAVLPAYKRVIFDEAHSIEDSATEYFGVSTSFLGVMASLGRFQRVERGRERGLIPIIRAKLVKDCPQVGVRDFEEIQNLLEKLLLPALATCRQSLKVAFDALRALTAEQSGQIGRDVKWRLTEAVLDESLVRECHAAYVMPAVDDCRLFVRHCNRLFQFLDVIERAPNQEEAPLAVEAVQLRAFARRVENAANVLAEGTSEELQENTVRWIEIDSKKEEIVRVIRCPLEVGPPLAEWCYGQLASVVMTSATLTVNQEFNYLFSRLGLDRVSADRLESQILDSPFRFDQQALLGIATDLPAPNERDFLDSCVDAIDEALKISRGHAFVLFTSFYAMDFTFNRLADGLRQAGITPLKQGQTARTRLLDQFRSDTSSVLFATDSFWEGVDVAGESLQCVILPKLPFRVPTEPVQQARAEAIEDAGGNPFMAYSVPQAVIKFRQGFGRLIRRRTDRGVILVLDGRIVSKYYGRIFLKSLPGVRVVKGPRPGLSKALARFFAASEEEE
jgi:ATP-dependent DNA helicase DinG